MSLTQWLPLLLLAAGAAHGAQGDLLVCGWDEVYILNAESGAKSFSWKAADRPELPAAYKDRFRTTDDCKPVAGERILITASSDGIALVDRSSGRTTFWGVCANAHSADLLPGERVAVACSERQQGGNRLAVFDARVPERELYSTELTSGHGAYWDEKRNVLWALGSKELRAYTLVNWSSARPSLELKRAYPLPSGGGHELSRAAGANLAISALRDVWLFDPERGKFTPHPQFGGMANIKSVSLNRVTGQIAFTQADSPEWWTSKIRFRNPDRVVQRENERLYKVRWVE
jgi:hypothetical protein